MTRKHSQATKTKISSTLAGHSISGETKAKISNTLKSKPVALSTEYNQRRFGRLVVIKELDRKVKPNGQKVRMFECLCDCGKTTSVALYPLTSNSTKSCGCLQKEAIANSTRTHGLSGTKIRNVHNSMKQRCDNPKNKEYANYGGRGITYCDKWKTLEGFLEDMGADYREGLSIDRIDADKNYQKDNCRWTTSDIQINNRRNTIMVDYKGNQVPLKQLCDDLNLNYHTVYQRVFKYGKPLLESLY